MGGSRGISHVDMPMPRWGGAEDVDAEGEPRWGAKMGMGGAEVYHMLICRGRAKMGGGRGISHVDMPRDSQDGGGQRYITC